MGIYHRIFAWQARWVAWALVAALAAPMVAGCSRQSVKGYRGQPGTTGQETPQYTTPAPQRGRTGMTRGQKVALLAGAAALYYLYRHHQNRQGAGSQGQYYLSKNGRVYYRDRNGRPVWVTPPPGGIQVPESEAQQYSRFRGYNGRDTGATFGGYGARHTPVESEPGGYGR